MQKRSGFTVTELIVIIALLSLLTAVAVPNFLSWLPKYRLRSAARDLFSNLQLAKMEAIKTNRNCSIGYEKNPDRYAITLLNKTVTLSDYKSGIRFQGPTDQTFAVANITFNSRGTSNAGYAYLTNSGNTAYYRVGPLTSGVIKLQKWSGGSVWK